MPRIYAAQDLTTTQNHVNFVNGAAAVKENDAAAIAYFTAAGCTIDDAKHKLTELDKLPLAAVVGFADYIGAVYDLSTDGKAEIIKAIETSISTKYNATVTVTSSEAGAQPGQTKITVSASAGAGYAYYYKTAATTPVAPLYGDEADATWTKFESPVEFVPTATHDKITVAKAHEATKFIVGSGNKTIVTNNT